MWSPDGATQQTTMLPIEEEDAMNASVQAMSGQLMSHNTKQNVLNNTENIDYCVDQFAFVSSRIKCIKLMTGNGPFLA